MEHCAGSFPACGSNQHNQHMFNKHELIEMMLRPQPMDDAIRDYIIADFMKTSIDEFIDLFRRETQLEIRPCGQNIFTIKY